VQPLTPKQLDVLHAMLSGRSATAAAQAVGIHRTTIHHWCRTIPQFRAALDDARQSRADAIKDQIYDLAAPALVLLKNTIENETVPPALHLRAALAVLKSAMQPEPLPEFRREEILQNEPNEQIHHISSLFSSESPVESAASDLQLPEPPQTSQTPQIPRGAPCPCGSGLKYKRCCGHNAPPVLSRAA